MYYESQYYGIVSPDQPYLMHHGVKGQKWGHRRYQYEDGTLTPLGRQRLGYSVKGLKSAGSIKRALNKTDREEAKSNYEVRKANRKVAKYEKKLSNVDANFSGRNANKAEKIKSQLETAKTKQRDANANLETVKKTADRIINNAVKNGYNVRSKTVVRDAARGKHILATGTFGLAGTVVSHLGPSSYSFGKKYKVAKASNGSKATYQHNAKGYSNTNKSAAAKYAVRRYLVGW